MRGNAKTAEPGDVLRYGVGITTEPVWRRRRAERDVVALVRVDSNIIHTDHPAAGIREAATCASRRRGR